MNGNGRPCPQLDGMRRACGRPAIKGTGRCSDHQPIPFDKMAERALHPQECPARHRQYDLSDCTCNPCGLTGHTARCGCTSGGEVQLDSGWIAYEEDGFTIEVEVVGR